MKYFIGTLIKGEAEKYQQKLLYSVAKKFRVNWAIETKISAHITLKYTFETEDIGHIEKNIAEFCKSHKRSKYQLKGFNHFKNEVIYIDVIPSKEMRDTYSKLTDHLNKNKDIPSSKFDGTIHFHSTIAYKDIQEKFQEIWDYTAKEKPDFDVVFDNITIFQFMDDIWEIYKEFPLK